MAVLYCETFDDPVNQLGINWDQEWQIFQGQFQKVDQKLQPFVCNWPNRVVHLGDTDTPDQFARVTIDALGSNSYVSIHLRVGQILAPKRSGYIFTYSKLFTTSDSAAFVEIAKIVNDVFTSLTIVAHAYTPGDILGARVIGDALTLLVNDVELLTTTDTDITSFKSFGMEVWFACTTPFGSMILDDFCVGDSTTEGDDEPPPTEPPGGTGDHPGDGGPIGLATTYMFVEDFGGGDFPALAFEDPEEPVGDTPAVTPEENVFIDFPPAPFDPDAVHG